MNAGTISLGVVSWEDQAVNQPSCDRSIVNVTRIPAISRANVVAQDESSDAKSKHPYQTWHMCISETTASSSYSAPKHNRHRCSLVHLSEVLLIPVLYHLILSTLVEVTSIRVISTDMASAPGAQLTPFLESISSDDLQVLRPCQLKYCSSIVTSPTASKRDWAMAVARSRRVRVSDCGRRLMAAEVSIVWPSNLLFVQSAGVSCAEVSGSVDDMEESVKFFSA